MNQEQNNDNRNQNHGRDPLNPEHNRQPYNELRELIEAANLNPAQIAAIQQNVASTSDCVSMCAMTVSGSECLLTMLAADGDGGLRDTILAAFEPDLPKLMVHAIGFEVVRALFLSCDERQMDTVVQLVLVRNVLDFIAISNNYYGRLVIRALIQNLKNEAQEDIVTNVLQQYILSFTNYEHRQNVLHFFIRTCNHDNSRTRLFNVMTNNCVHIAKNELGSRLLQGLIRPMFIEGGFISSLLDAIVSNVFELAKDKYGSYLVQRVIDANVEGETKRIVEELMGSFCKLAMSQTGSLVVEKCLKKCEQSEVVNIVEEFTNSSQLCTIAQHHYGHHVIRRALLCVATQGTVQHYRNLVDGIKLHASTLKYYTYGRIVIRRIGELNSRYPFLCPQ